MLTFREGNAKHMQSLQILHFQGLGTKTLKASLFLVIPRGKELDHRTWSYDRAFEQRSEMDVRWGNLNTKFSKIPDIPDPAGDVC